MILFHTVLVVSVKSLCILHPWQNHTEQSNQLILNHSVCVVITDCWKLLVSVENVNKQAMKISQATTYFLKFINQFLLTMKAWSVLFCVQTAEVNWGSQPVCEFDDLFNIQYDYDIHITFHNWNGFQFITCQFILEC